MKQKLARHHLLVNKWIFSIFDFEEEENEIIPIVESPLEYK